MDLFRCKDDLHLILQLEDDMSSLQSTELFQQHINGQWLAAQSNATVPVTNPATGEEIGTIPNMGAAEATQAVEAAYSFAKLEGFNCSKPCRYFIGLVQTGSRTYR